MGANKRDYLKPTADITEFECEDVITTSLANTIDNKIPTVVDSASAFKYVGAESWNKVYGTDSSAGE